MTMKPDRAIGVLVVDDSLVFRTAVATWVGRQPSTRLVGVASNGREAVELVKRLAPEVVLMDVFMPEMDGFEATRIIKSLPDAPLVILLSVSDEAAMEHAALTAGADRFVPKPEFASMLPGLVLEYLEEKPATEG